MPTSLEHHQGHNEPISGLILDPRVEREVEES